MNTARNYLAAAGIQTAALGFGGNTTVPVSTTEEYDGTSWAATTSMNTARGVLAGAGTKPAALAFGGNLPGVSNATEEFTITGTKGIKTVTVS